MADKPKNPKKSPGARKRATPILPIAAVVAQASSLSGPQAVDQTNLGNWFAFLLDLQTGCAKINTSADPKKMTLLAFANAKITALLPSANEQGQFIINAKVSPGIDIAPNDLFTRFSTFKDLQVNFNNLPDLLAMCLRDCAAGAFPSGTLKSFLAATISAAFPGGSTGPNWSAAKQLLTSTIPAVCFTTTLQTAAAKTVDGGTQTVSSLRDQIAALG
jgi:hypothetical protein